MAGTQPHARVLSPKFGETNCENPFACELTLSRGPSALYFSHETHAKRKNQPFPTSRMGVARGCGPHLQPGRLKKLSNLFFRSGNTTQICLNLFDTKWVGGLGRTFRIVPNFSSFCPYRSRSLPSFLPCFSTHHSQHVSGSSKVHLRLFRPIVKIESFWLFQPPQKIEPHSFKTPFLFVFPFFSGLASPSSGIAALFRKISGPGPPFFSVLPRASS